MASMDVDAASGRRYGMDNEDDERIAAQLDADAAEEEEEVVIDPADVERRLQAMENAMDASDVLAPAFPPVSASELVVRRRWAARRQSRPLSWGSPLRRGLSCVSARAVGQHPRLAVGGRPAAPLHAAQGPVAQDLHAHRREHEAPDPHEPQDQARRAAGTFSDRPNADAWLTEDADDGGLPPWRTANFGADVRVYRRSGRAAEGGRLCARVHDGL